MSSFYIDRLLAHVFDPELDQSNPREFVIYACPQGTLGRQIEDYMEANLCRCGRNGAHKSFPHVTLCQFFKVGTFSQFFKVNTLCQFFKVDTFSQFFKVGTPCHRHSLR